MSCYCFWTDGWVRYQITSRNIYSSRFKRKKRTAFHLWSLIRMPVMIGRSKKLRIGELYEPARLRRLLVQVSGSPQLVGIRTQNPEIYAFYASVKMLQTMEDTCRT